MFPAKMHQTDDSMAARGNCRPIKLLQNKPIHINIAKG